MENTHYYKEHYIERCRTQIEAFRLLQLGQKALYSSLPVKDGGQFNKKSIEKLNKLYEGKHIRFYFRDDWSGRHLCINLYDAKYCTVAHETTIGWMGMFAGGKVNGLKDLCADINIRINNLDANIARYEKAVEESQIRLFQAKYAAFYKAYEELKSMDMPEVRIEYLSDICPIR